MFHRVFSTIGWARVGWLVILGVVVSGSAGADAGAKASAELTVDERPDRWVVQRQRVAGSWIGGIPVTGTLESAGDAVEARVVRAADGVEVLGWTVIDPAPTDGRFAGRLDRVPQGGWYWIEARSTAQPTGISRTSGRFGVGLVVAAIGQSNMVKMFTEDEADGSVTPPFATPDPSTRRYGYGEPPGYDYKRPRTVDIPISWGEVTGSGGIRLANSLATELGVPVLMLDFSVDWTGLHDHWNREAHRAWARFAEALDLIGEIGVVLWHQGAYDANETIPTATDYQAGLDRLYERITDRVGGHGSLPMVVAIQNRGDYDDDPAKDDRYDAIRQGQLDWIASRPHGFAAGTTLDIEISSRPRTGSGHFWAAGYQEVADRYLRGILHALGAPGYELGVDGGQLASASVRGNRVVVQVAHDVGTRLRLADPASAVEGFALTDGEWTVDGVRQRLAILDARLSDEMAGNWLELELATAPSGPLRLRYLHGQNPFYDRATKEARRAGGNILLDDFAYHPERVGLPIHGTTSELVVTPALGLTADTTFSTVPEGGTTQLAIRLLDAPSGPVVVMPEVVGDADLTIVGGELSFDPDDWETPRLVTLAGEADGDTEDGRGLLRLRAAGYQPLAVELSEQDSDPHLEIVPAALSLPRTGGHATFSVALGAPPAGPVVLDLAAAHLDITPSRLLFDADDWHRAKPVSVTSSQSTVGQDLATRVVVGVDATASVSLYGGLDEVVVPVELAGIDSGLLTHWPLDEATGSATEDVSGNGRHGTIGDAVTLGLTGVLGTAMRTAEAGPSSHSGGLVASAPSGTELDQLTVAFWYRLPEDPAPGYLLTWGGSYNRADSVSLFLDPGLEIRARIHDSTDEASVVSFAPDGFDDSRWHHLAVVKDSEGSRLYLDGVAQFTPVGAGTITPRRGITLGTNETGGYATIATIDELRLYDRALSHGEVVALSRLGTAPLTVALEPPAAVVAGARWRLAGESVWHQSDATRHLVPGEHVVVFESVEGWRAPASRSVSLGIDGASLTGTFVEEVVRIEPIAHLPLDQVDGSATPDISGSGFDGQLVDGGTLVDGVFGSGLRIAAPGGSDQHAGLQVDALAGMALERASVAFWYRLPNNPHDGYLVSWGGSNRDPSHYSIFLDIDRGLRVRCHHADETQSVVEVAPAGFADQAWHHLALIKDTDGATIYFDGRLVGQSGMGAGEIVPPVGLRLAANENGEYGADASFDDLRVWSRALDASEVADLHSAGELSLADMWITPMATTGGSPPRLGWARTTDQVLSTLLSIADQHTEIVELIDYGDSRTKLAAADSGDDLVAARVTRRSIGGPKPVMIVLASPRVDRLVTSELALRFLDWLSRGDGVDPVATWLVDHHEIWILPLTDPDGRRRAEAWPEASFDEARDRTAPTGIDCPRWTTTAAAGPDLAHGRPIQRLAPGALAASVGACAAADHEAFAVAAPEIRGLVDLIEEVIASQRRPGTRGTGPTVASGIAIRLLDTSRAVAWTWSDRDVPRPDLDVDAFRFDLAVDPPSPDGRPRAIPWPAIRDALVDAARLGAQ